jgi:hypothetical protein
VVQRLGCYGGHFDASAKIHHRRLNLFGITVAATSDPTTSSWDKPMARISDSHLFIALNSSFKLSTRGKADVLPSGPDFR